MKKLILIVLLFLLVGIGIVAWMVIGPGTGFKGEKETLYIRTNAATKQAVLDSLTANGIIKNQTVFSFLANRMQYWSQIKPGKYDIKKGSSVLSVIRMLRNGQQSPVNLVI
ncbi:MAG TPA: endolytic transglycosylase MltG, partial [Flavisolibacter sp.]|nr:endolytic transglycosylase MltG [Flavisolibacter sp.]